MGILTRGQYTHGSQSWTDILTLSSSRELNLGDTVFDTTYNKKRMWDGFNFVHTHQISVPISGSGVSYGGAMTVAANADDQVRFTVSATDNEGIIGIAEDQKGSVNGDRIPIHYHGDAKLLAEAGGGGASLDPSDYMDIGTLQQFSNVVTTAAAGIYALYLDTGTTTNSTIGNPATLKRVLFRPVERN